MTEICDRVLRAGGPAMLFEKPEGPQHPGAGQPVRHAAARRAGHGRGRSVAALREVGKLLAYLKEPEPPKGLKDAWDKLPVLKQVLNMAPKEVAQRAVPGNRVGRRGRRSRRACRSRPAGRATSAPLITWGLVVTRGPHKTRQNLGIYRQQVIAPQQGHHALAGASRRRAGFPRPLRRRIRAQPFPVAVALGADPATILGAVTPVPDSLSEYQFAGLLRGAKTELVKCLGSDLQVPASRRDRARRRDPSRRNGAGRPVSATTPATTTSRTEFPVFTIERITMRRDPIYHSTYTGKPPDEPAMLGVALNEVFVPLLQKQFPEITDFYLPPEGCSYRMAVVSMKKQYPGHAKRVMFGVWSFLRQFMYTKFIIVTDDDVDIRDWKEVIWAMTTRVDPARDTLLVENTPIDYLDFASPVSGLGCKMGIDATNKWPGETSREWGTPIVMDAAVKARVDALWKDLGL